MATKKRSVDAFRPLLYFLNPTIISEFDHTRHSLVMYLPVFLFSAVLTYVHGYEEALEIFGEGIWHYNIEGRSATDGADQQRKKLNLAERRIVRAGPKGILCALDIA